MSSIGLTLTVILLLLKAFAIGVFVSLSWWIVFLPLIICVVVDIVLAIIGFSFFKSFGSRF